MVIITIMTYIAIIISIMSQIMIHIIILVVLLSHDNDTQVMLTPPHGHDIYYATIQIQTMSRACHMHVYAIQQPWRINDAATIVIHGAAMA